MIMTMMNQFNQVYLCADLTANNNNNNNNNNNISNNRGKWNYVKIIQKIPQQYTG